MSFLRECIEEEFLCSESYFIGLNVIWRYKGCLSCQILKNECKGWISGKIRGEELIEGIFVENSFS